MISNTYVLAMVATDAVRKVMALLGDCSKDHKGSNHGKDKAECVDDGRLRWTPGDSIVSVEKG